MSRKLILTSNQSAERDLADRAWRMKPRGEPPQLDSLPRAVQFLRGVSSRAAMTLPAYYLFLGSMADGEPMCSIAGYPGLLLRKFLEFSTINIVSLACRNAFDQKVNGLTGGYFGKSSDKTLDGVAAYWSRHSGRPAQDARVALDFLRSIFKEFSKTDTQLLEGPSPLGLRIGLLKQHGDRTAAHLSLENHEFSTLDCAHVVAALVMIGAIITSFDNRTLAPSYFDDLDEAAASAARQLFPGAPNYRLFQEFKVETQSQLCWQGGVKRGRLMLERLPYMTGWW